jgi:stage V sporulation protein B
MSKQSFLRGAMILASAGVATKSMNMVIQVVIARHLGAQGFGLFQAINPIFYLLLTISTLALPPALSKVIAENLAIGNVLKVRRALKLSNATVVILSITVCSITIVIAPMITNKWLDPRAALPFTAALFRVPVGCLSGILSGYYMGIQNQTPPAVAWIIETMTRTAITIPLILLMNPYGISYGALAVMIGAGIGESAGYLYMLWHYLSHRHRFFEAQAAEGTQSAHGTVRDLVHIALPTTVTNLSGIIAFAVEPMIIYIAFAHTGIGKTAATSLYGAFGMSIELLLLPTVLSSSLSSVVIPAVSEAAAMRDDRTVSHRLNQVIQATFLIALPSTVFFILSGHDLAHSLYRNHLAGALLAYMAPVCIFIYTLDPLSAVLQGLNKAALSTMISIVSSVIRLSAIYYFVGFLHDGIYGVAAAICISGIVSALLSVFFVRKFVYISVNLINLSKMVIATALASIPVHQIQVLWYAYPPVLQVVCSAFIGTLIYFLALIYLRLLPVSILEEIPWVGHRLVRALLCMPFVPR